MFDNIDNIKTKSLKVNKLLAIMSENCDSYILKPTDDNKNKVIESFVEIDKEIDSLKSSIASIINIIETEEQIGD